jgi:hypothetical protein
MLFVIGTLVILLLVFGPQLWTRYIFKRYSTPIDELPGTGGELARHLLDRFDMHDTRVELTESESDHYDPRDKTIRLSEQVFNGKSLTAVTIAAHETGHALQHMTHYKPLYLRWKLAGIVSIAEKIASIMLISTPFLAMLTRMPVLSIITLAGGITILLMPVVFHLLTLPVELNASFGRALPILAQGNYLPKSALPIARRILTAAAFTYLAASLASLLNFYRWMAFLRR